MQIVHRSGRHLARRGTGVRDLEGSTGARRRSKCTASLCTGVRRPRRGPDGSLRPRLHPPMVCPPPPLHRAQRVKDARLPGNSRQNPKISRPGPERGRAARAPDLRRRHQRQDRGCIRGGGHREVLSSGIVVTRCAGTAGAHEAPKALGCVPAAEEAGSQRWCGSSGSGRVARSVQDPVVATPRRARYLSVDAVP